jgi:hypothetical protein
MENTLVRFVSNLLFFCCSRYESFCERLYDFYLPHPSALQTPSPNGRKCMLKSVLFGEGFLEKGADAPFRQAIPFYDTVVGVLFECQEIITGVMSGVSTG